MANLLNFYFEQLVTESDMDTLQANLQQADHFLMKDQLYIGVNQGYAVVEHNPVPDLTVDVGGPGIAYDQEGQRINMPTTTTLDLSVDSNGSPTAVAVAGNEKWVSVFIQFNRTLSDSRFDGNGVPLFYRQDEAFQFVVEQGAEALIGAAARPALRSDALLIADVNLTNGKTQIFDADIESADTVTKPNSRFQFAFNLTASSPAQIRVGPLPDAMQAVLTELNNHIANVGNAHPASAITFDPANLPIPAGWAGLSAATEVQGAIDAIASDLGNFAAGTYGALRVGFDGATGTWADGGNLSSNDAGNAINEIVNDLADSAGFDGAGRVGYEDANFTGAGYSAATTVADAFDVLATESARLAGANTFTGTSNTFQSSFAVENDSIVQRAPQHSLQFNGGTPGWVFEQDSVQVVSPGAGTIGVRQIIPLTGGGVQEVIRFEVDVLVWTDGSLTESMYTRLGGICHTDGAGTTNLYDAPVRFGPVGGNFFNGATTPVSIGVIPTLSVAGGSIQLDQTFAGSGTVNYVILWSYIRLDVS